MHARTILSRTPLSRTLVPLALLLSIACEKEQPAPNPPTGDLPAKESTAAEPDHSDDGPDDGPGDSSASAADKAIGDACLSAGECASGICEGEGCGDQQPGTCADANRMCTRDYVNYCGCDGEQFGGSGSCPGNRYAHKGEC